jgi:hypothetical protein
MASLSKVRELKGKYDDHNSFIDEDDNLNDTKIKVFKQRPLSSSCSNMHKLSLNSTVTGDISNSTNPRYLEVTKSSLIRMSHYSESIKHDTHKSDMYKPNELASSLSQPTLPKDKNELNELNYKNNLAKQDSSSKKKLQGNKGESGDFMYKKLFQQTGKICWGNYCEFGKYLLIL